MSNEYEVEDISQKDGIELSESAFRRLVINHNLPIFKYKYRSSLKAKTWDNEETFTIFQGMRMCVKTERVRVSSEK